jgi:GNAT superfamily N-acetyltransferase
MNEKIVVKPPSECTEDIPILVNYFLQEWPDHYGDNGPGDAQEDIENYASGGSLPIGFVAYYNNFLCGLMALKADSISTHTHLGPWVAAGFVVKELRNHGVGARLLSAIEKLATDMEISKLYSGTAQAHGLLLRAGWHSKETVLYNGEDVSIYQKQL